MFARKLSSEGRIRWPAPCRARNATRFPRSVPITNGPDGSPNGVWSVCSSRSISSAISYRPLPPSIPKAERVAVKSQRGVEILDGNADVIENSPHKNQAISDFRFQIADFRLEIIEDCRLAIAVAVADYQFRCTLHTQIRCLRTKSCNSHS